MAEYTNQNLKKIWQETLDLIQTNHDFDNAIFNTWIKDSSLYDIDEEFAIIVVPYKINKQIMLENILMIQSRLSSVLEKDMQCQIFLKAEVDNLTPNSVVKRRNDELFENKIKKQYNFDNFIIGKSNRDAQAAALNCCYYPGNYNPLFIYGNSGLGKTHLLHAIGNYVLENQPDKQVLYIYSEDFVTLLIDAMKNKTVEDVKERISKVDYLLIDDIQRLTQSASQEIFFNLYNKLVSDNKQIVITSDMHPSELKGIENRLISRFSSGLSITIGSPEFETAKAILRKKLEGRQDDIIIEDAVLDYIATRFSSDVRKLEGTLNELFFKAILYNPETINLEFAKEIFKEDPSFAKSENITPAKIKKAVCEFYGLTRHQIESKSRTANIANARHIAVYLCRKHLEMPFAKIGFEFGNRDHSTIMSSYEKMVKMLKEKESFQQAVIKIENKLGIH